MVELGHGKSSQDTSADYGFRLDDLGRHWLDLLLGPPQSLGGDFGALKRWDFGLMG